MQLNFSVLVIVLAFLSNGSFAAAPTRYPSAKPTLTPTHKPSADPSASPTIRPTAVPTGKPTFAPSTEVPTCDPTRKPTFSPTTSIPTATPTAEPTVEPTWKPSGVPTYMPTHEPTVAPTYEPTNVPTYAPTNEPTTNPTFSPTNQPTTATPSRSPTIRPTAVPTLTFAPSIAPTRQDSPVVQFFANITINDAKSPVLDSDGMQVIAVSTAQVMGLPSSTVTFLSVGESRTYDMPRLAQKNAAARKALKETLYSYPVTLRVSAALDLTNYATPNLLYNTTMHKLLVAAADQGYDAVLQANAQTYGTPDLFGGTTYQVEISPATVVNPDYGKEKVSGLTGGGTAIIVICVLVMTAVILYMAWDLKFKKHVEPTPEEPKGYAVAEDEEAATVTKL